MNLTINLTEKELLILNKVKEFNTEDGYSEFTSDYVKTKSIAGVVSSLYQKGLIYDCYEDCEEYNFKMWCLSLRGIELVGTCEGYEDYT